MTKTYSLKYLGFIVLMKILVACSSKSEVIITLQSNNSLVDTISIKNIATEETVILIPINGTKEGKLEITEPLYALIGSGKSENSYISIFTPEQRKTIIIDTTSIRTSSVADSLERYFTKSTNYLLAKHGNLIFSGKGEDRVISIFDSLIQARTQVVEEQKDFLTQVEYEILRHHNRAKAYSFLFFYGRYIRDFSANNPFFGFIDNIDSGNKYVKTQPNNLLYKYEIMYLRDQDSIQSIQSFVSFIEDQTTNNDLADFLKITYLRAIIESPDYWQRHQQMFITDDIKDALKREDRNPYKHLLENTFDSYHSSRKGEPAYDFQAIMLDSTLVNLSDYKGKLVLIDVWATWCGPCLEHRPNFIELAKKYEDNDSIQVMMLSVDKSLLKWRSYTAKSNPEKVGTEVNIQDGLNDVLREKYFVTGIPTYILIDADGFIIDANLPEPSIKMEEMIEKALAEM